jgi:hypothetical protein
MLSLGACIVGNATERFYIELRPINDSSVPAAMAIIGKSLEEFRLAVGGERWPRTSLCQFQRDI